MNEKGISMVGAVIMIASSALATAGTLGTYGYLTEKKRWSSWSAGAAVGAMGAALSVVVIMAFGGSIQQGAASLLSPSTSMGALDSIMKMPVSRTRLNTIPRIMNATVGQAIGAMSCGRCG